METRRQRRTVRKRLRKFGAMLAVVTALGFSGAVAGTAFANGSGGRYDQCSPGPNTTGSYRSGYRNYNSGNAWNACD
jgi:hypothetical protein